VGGVLNGFTSEEATCYFVKIPRRYMDLALDVLSDMVIHPALPEKEVEKERQVILEEIKMYKDQPQSYVYELLDGLLWPRQPLGEPIIGSAESVNRIKRDDLLNFKQNFYTPADIVVSAAGSLQHDELRKKVQRIFVAHQAKSRNTFLKAQENQSRPQLKILHKDTEQTHLALGFHSFRRDHPLKHAQGLLHVILGANMSSRLFNEVREKKGLAYEIGTVIKRFQDTGSFIVHAGIDNRKAASAIEVILKELKKISSRLVTADEFRRAKEFYLGQLMLALEDTLDQMLWIAETTATLDRTYTIQEITKEVGRVTREDIREAANSVFCNKKLNLALIGPLTQEKEISGMLKLD
jgi:predicted Zn-dependent peptidase